MTKKPLVSVIMPTFNNAEYITDSINSVLSQDYRNFELIIINDGSTDKTKTIIEKVAKYDKRIKIINQTNQGIVKSLNRGLEIAVGKYIARIDSDDQWLPHKLKTQLEYLESHPKTVIVSGGMELIDQLDRPFAFHLTSHLPEQIIRAITIGNVFVHSSVVFCKDIAKKCGNYPDVCPIEDYSLFSNMLDYGEAYVMPFPLIRYRSNPNGISQKNAEKQAHLADKLSVQLWDKFPPEVLTKKSIKTQTQELLKCSLTPEFGNLLKYNFLFTNVRIGYRMFRYGRKFEGIKQLLNIASSSRLAFKLVVDYGKCLLMSKIFKK